MRLFWPHLAFSAIIAAGIFPAFAAGSEAARVAIIRYDDKTGTKNFEYMPGSLQEAITKSMHKKFEFVEVDASKVEPIAADIRAKNKGKITPKEAAEICRQADIDILIYGNFTFDKANNEIEIHTEISLGSPDKFRSLQPTENRVDATIFGAADKVAGDITAEITKVALEQQQKRGKEAKDAKDKKGKTQLEKTEKSKTWAEVNWMFTASMGPSMPLISRDNADPKVDGMISVHGVKRLKGNWHLGVFGSYGGVKSAAKSGGTRTDIELWSGAVTGGYFFDLSPRWRATTSIGAGYYFGALNRYIDCGTSCSNGSFTSENIKIRNPFGIARAGIHFLIFSFLSLGLEADYRMYFDSPKPVQVGHASLSISAVF
ncbi:MAG: autotransporter domain-containing protein [Turneriella sp.]|nr:autotransporter domain-containing protein [Turneriella sp.]